MSVSSIDPATRNSTMRDLQDIQTDISTYGMEHAHAAIDHHISELETRIRSLRTLRNRRANISSLPNEVLATILTTAAAPAQDSAFQTTSWFKHVRLTAVCSLWREVALQCPSFWSCIPIKECERLQDMLDRSKSHPLAIRIDHESDYSYLNSGPLSDSNLAMVMQPHRIRQLHLRGPQAALERYMKAIPEDIPELQSLTLDIVSKSSAYYGPKKYVCAPLPLHVLCAPKPALQHLELNECRIDWESIREPTLPISNLLTLTLKALDPPMPHHLLLGVLAASPRIETVEARRVIANDAEPLAGEVQDVICLPRVKQYSIGGPLITILNHRTHLRLPSTAKVSFSASHPPPSVSDSELESDDEKKISAGVLRFLSVFGLIEPSESQQFEEKYSLHSGKPSFESLYLDMDVLGINIRLYKSRTSNFEVLALLEEDPPHDLRLQLPTSLAAKKTIFQVLHVLNLKELRLRMQSDTRHPVSTSSWRAFLTRHSEVDKLSVLTREPSHLLKALGSVEFSLDPKPASVSYYAEDEDPRTLRYCTTLALPSLKTLLLDCVTFDMFPQIFSPHQGRNFAALYNTCIDRCNYELPLPTIFVRISSGFDDMMEELLEEVVGAGMVIWDGIDTREDDDDDEDDLFDDEFDDDEIYSSEEDYSDSY